jgi:hypothetical protein
MTDDTSYESPVDINIENSLPIINVGRGNHIRFESTDKKDYKVNFDPQDITDESLPFPVPGDGKVHSLKVKDAAPEQSYKLQIWDQNSVVDEDGGEKSEYPDVMMSRQNPPRMIIKVE